ncbi:MAG: glycogen/starch synthase [Clostridium sp.]|nr:glycogen/starch synthase [Clostridium sp.]
MAKEKVLFISQQIAPYLKADHLSTLGRDIPQGVMAKGYEVRTFMPKYGSVNERRNQLHEVIRLSGMNIPIDDNDHPLIIKVATLQPSRMQVYFIDNDDYFSSPQTSELETVSDKTHNDERLMFYTRGVIETVKKLRWDPKFIQCDGWLTALAPLYMRRLYANDPTFSNAKIVYTLRDDAFDGSLDPRFVEKLTMAQVDPDDLAVAGSGVFDHISLGKLAVNFADAVVVSTENVAPELLEYAAASGKPVMPYPGDDALLPQAVADFYNQITTPEE